MALACAGLIVGAVVAGATLMRELGKLLVFLLPSIFLPTIFACWRLSLREDSTLPIRNILRSAKTFLITALISFLLVRDSLVVVEPQLVYHYSDDLSYDGKYDLVLNGLVSCGARWYAFGHRTATEGGIYYVEAAVWYLTGGEAFHPAESDPPNRDGVPRLHHPGSIAHRSFLGALCENGRTIAYGWDTWSGADEGHDSDGAIWLQEGDGWRRQELGSVLGGSGTQRIVGLTNEALWFDPEESPGDGPPPVRRPRDPYLAVVAGGEGEGARCWTSSDLTGWESVGQLAMDDWYVDRAVLADGAFVALAHRTLTDPARTRESALFRSEDCRRWKWLPIPETLQYNTILSSLDRVDGEWFLSGWTSPYVHGESRPLLAISSEVTSLRVLDLDGLITGTGRGLYAVGKHDNKIVALGFDHGAAPGDSDNIRRKVFAIPVRWTRANAIQVPGLGIRYGSSHSNVAGVA